MEFLTFLKINIQHLMTLPLIIIFVAIVGAIGATFLGLHIKPKKFSGTEEYHYSLDSPRNEVTLKNHENIGKKAHRVRDRFVYYFELSPRYAWKDEPYVEIQKIITRADIDSGEYITRHKFTKDKILLELEMEIAGPPPRDVSKKVVESLVVKVKSLPFEVGSWYYKVTRKITDLD